MTTAPLPDLSAFGQNGFVSASDVRTLRQSVFKDQIVSHDELAALLALAERAPDGDPEWRTFFAEATADFYLREEVPHGYLTEAEWRDLNHQVTRYSNTVTPLVLGMLVKLVALAKVTPPQMSDFIGDQFRRMVKARGETASITKADADLLRDFIFAIGGDENVAVSRREAELLFDLNDLTLSVENDPAWSDLFVKAIANHLMCHIGYQPVDRDTAMRQWDWVSDHSVDVGGFFKRMLSGGTAAIRNAYAKVPEGEATTTYEHLLRTRAFQSDRTEEVCDHEADWLADRIARDGVTDDNERALIAYMLELEDELPDRLRGLLASAA